MRDIKGNVVNIQVSGPASATKAKKLAEPRKIMLGGDLTGSVEFDGSQDVVLEAKVLKAQEKPDYSQNDEAQPDYIKNRPGGYDVVTPGVTIQWDGVRGDRTVLTIVNDDIFRDVKISDVVLTKEMLIGALADGVEVQEGHITEGDGYVSLAMGSKQILSFSKTGSVEVNGFEHQVTETGTYAYVPSMASAPSNLYIAELVTANVVKPVKIPAKYLDLAMPDYHQNDATQLDYIKNRPGGYYQAVQGVDITWDGVIGDRPKAQPDEGVYLVKVGDEVLTAEQVIGAKMTGVFGGEAQAVTVTSGDVVDTGEYIFVSTRLSIGIVSTSVLQAAGVTFPETGTYFVNASVDEQTFYISSLQSAERRALVPIPGELTNIKGGYDLPAISNQPVYSGTVPASTFSAATQAAKIAVAAVIEKNYGAPITLTNPLAEGATVNGTVNGTAVSGVVAKNSAGDLNAALYTTGASEQVAVVAEAGGSGGTLVCILTSDAVVVRGDPPETDMVLVLSQSREAMPKVIPAEYLDVDLSAVESRINIVESVANNAFNKATTAQTTANAAQATANSAQTAATSEIRTNNLCFRSFGKTDNQTTDIPSNLGVRIGNMYKSSTAMQYYPVSLTVNRGLEFSADIANPSENHVRLYTEKSNNIISGVLQLSDNFGHFITIRPDSIVAYQLTFEHGIIIRSSTAGSTRKFKITVDDTGTLSATEVTT